MKLNIYLPRNLCGVLTFWVCCKSRKCWYHRHSRLLITFKIDLLSRVRIVRKNYLRYGFNITTDDYHFAAVLSSTGASVSKQTLFNNHVYRRSRSNLSTGATLEMRVRKCVVIGRFASHMICRSVNWPYNFLIRNLNRIGICFRIIYFV